MKHPESNNLIYIYNYLIFEDNWLLYSTDIKKHKISFNPVNFV